MKKGKGGNVKRESIERVECLSDGAPSQSGRILSYFHFHPFSRFHLFTFSLLALAFCHASASAQTVEPDTVPPPAKIVSRDVREKLESEPDDKKRTALALAFMDTYLKQAEAELGKEEFAGVYRELGGFHFLMDTTLAHLLYNEDGSSKSLGNLKRFEIGLRAFAPRLELIRRELPSNYEPYVMRLLRYLRDSRSKAIDPLFGSE